MIIRPRSSQAATAVSASHRQLPVNLSGFTSSHRQGKRSPALLVPALLVVSELGMRLVDHGMVIAEVVGGYGLMRVTGHAGA